MECYWDMCTDDVVEDLIEEIIGEEIVSLLDPLYMKGIGIKTARQQI